MVTDDITLAKDRFLKDHRLIGIDYGEKRIGIAISDLRWKIASPLQTIIRQKFSTTADILRAIIKERQVGGIIIGLPLNMDASAGPRVQSTRAFARNIAKAYGLAVAFWDERLSTIAAERTLLEADISRSKRKNIIDNVAAGYILQGALDRLQNCQKAQIEAGENHE